jgi:regulator of protease activity HflC (stomatin/prohibitin superfamily)
MTNEENYEQDEENYVQVNTGRGAISFLVALIPFLIFGIMSLIEFSRGSPGFGFFLGFLAIFLAYIGGSMVRVNKEWEQAVILRFGKFKRTVGAGIFFIIPFVESVIARDMRIRTLDIPPQEVITNDNISIKVDAVIFMQVVDVKKSVINVHDYEFFVKKFGQTTLRNTIGQKSLDDILEKASDVARSIQQAVDVVSDKWGVEIQKVELQNIELPENMKRVIAIQAEAERESKAILTKAQAEKNASLILKEASMNMKDPNAMQLRILQSISEVSKDQANTIIMALPMETLKYLGPGGIGALSSINSSDARKRAQSKERK